MSPREALPPIGITDLQTRNSGDALALFDFVKLPG